MHWIFRLTARTGFGILAALAANGSGAQDAAAGKVKAGEACAACHGADGNSSNELWPSLAGQTARYLYLELRDFKEGRRSDPVMSAIAQTLSRDDMFNLAAYYSAQAPRPSTYKTDPDRIERGKAVAASSLCTMCHLGGFSGQNEIPRVADQQFQYIVKQLKDFRERRRTNDGGNMTAYTKTLSDDDILNLANYITDLD
jgi:cytochrome c553